MTMNEKIREYLESLDDSSLIAFHNRYCDETNNYDDRIYSMCEFDEMMEGFTPSEIAARTFYGHDFNPNRDYFYFNGYGNLESGDYVSELPIYVGDIADYIERTGDDMDDVELSDILNGEEDEDEEAA